MIEMVNGVRGGVLLRADGAALLQLRDETIGIAHPGQESLFVEKFSPRACQFLRNFQVLGFVLAACTRTMLGYDRGSID